jgi:lysylphosphatidylglycerol synthetase-like protein (DUF2156 family)
MIPRESVASIIDEIECISDEWLVKYAGEREKRFSVAADKTAGAEVVDDRAGSIGPGW